MKEKFRTMLEMQAATNDLLIPGWRTKRLAYQDAIWTECAELLDHIGWKWWKKQEPNMEQAKMEMVDIWHFGMSLGMESYPVDELVNFYSSRSNYISEETVLTTTELIRDIAANAAQHNEFVAVYFFLLMNKLGMTLDDLYVGYVGKNVLNKFRKLNGYKEGTYSKNWLGEEDNEYLTRLLFLLPLDSETLIPDLEALLATRYEEVKAVAAEVLQDGWLG